MKKYEKSFFCRLYMNFWPDRKYTISRILNLITTLQKDQHNWWLVKYVFNTVLALSRSREIFSAWCDTLDIQMKGNVGPWNFLLNDLDVGHKKIRNVYYIIIPISFHFKRLSFKITFKAFFFSEDIINIYLEFFWVMYL